MLYSQHISSKEVLGRDKPERFCSVWAVSDLAKWNTTATQHATRAQRKTKCYRSDAGQKTTGRSADIMAEWSHRLSHSYAPKPERLLKIDRAINNVFIKLPIGHLLVVKVTLVVLQVTLIFILRHYSKSPANNINSLSAPISRVISTLLMEAEIANGHRTPTF